jgi:glycosyltransferase involved in cell wall biosynthesis
VTFFGYIPHEEFPRYYTAADVFVFPSLNEGMSNSLLEALASGLPVIATPTGGTDELITEGSNGFVVPFQDPQAIASKLESLINDRDLARSMGQASRSKAESMSWRSVATATEAEYQRYFSQTEDSSQTRKS